MEYTIFGRTGLTVSRTGFGCIPIQRVPYEESTALLRRAFEQGVTLYDTANAYTTSEERIGLALGDVRGKIILCTKSAPSAPDAITVNLENSLRMLKTDYIDVYQVHNPPFVPKPGGTDGIYDSLAKAKARGAIRFIGLTAHNRLVAEEAAVSGLYDTIQYPLSYLSSPEEIDLVLLCQKHNIGYLAMKGLCGGLLTHTRAAFAFLRQYAQVVPIWGMQKMEELDEFLAYEKDPPVMDEALTAAIGAEREELGGSFCRSCGYCLPCPAGIPIPNAARITFLMRRAVRAHFVTEEWRRNMRRIDDCTGCGQCKARCPYGLDTPKLLKTQQREYFSMLQASL